MRRIEEINIPFKDVEPSDFKFLHGSKINFNPIVEYNIIHNCHPVDMHPESLRGRYSVLKPLKSLKPKSSKIPHWYQQYTDSITNPNQWILTFERLFLEYIVPKGPYDSYTTDYQCVLVDSATNAMQAIAHFYSLFELDNTFRRNPVSLKTTSYGPQYILSKNEISPIDSTETRSHKPNEYLVPNKTYHSVVHAIRNGDPKAKIFNNIADVNSPESIRLTHKDGLSNETSSNGGPIYDMNGIVDACWCTFQENDLNVLLDRAPFVVVSLGPNKPFGWLGLTRGAVIIFRKDIHIEFSKNHKFSGNNVEESNKILLAHDYFNHSRQSGRSSYDCFIYSWLKRYTHNGRDSGKYVKDDILLAKEYRIKRFWKKGHTERYFSTYGIRANLTPEAIRPAVTKLLESLEGKELERPKNHSYANINTIFNPDEYFPFTEEPC